MAVHITKRRTATTLRYIRLTILLLLAALCVNCSQGVAWVDVSAEVIVSSRSALTAGSVKWVNGTYGASCTGHVNGSSWSLAATTSTGMPYSPLAVVANNSACILTLTQVAADKTYTTTSAIALTTSYNVAASAFGTGGGTTAFWANAKLSNTTYSSPLVLTLLVSPNPSDSSTSNTAYQWLSPPSITMTIGAGSYTYTPTAGTPPYSWTVLSGPGSITGGGVFTPAGPGGASVVRVTDNLGSMATSAVSSVRHTTNGTVRAIVSDGSSHFLGGDFDTVNPYLAPKMIAVSATSGAPNLAFDLQSGFDGDVYAIVISDGYAYVGGEFANYRGSAARYVAKLNAATGILDTTFTQSTGPNAAVYGLAISSTALYLTGAFTTYRGATAQRLARVDTATGDLNTNFTQSTGLDATGRAILVDGTSVYVGGDFLNYRGTTANYVAKVAMSTGAKDGTFTGATGAGASVHAMALSGSALYLGGAFLTYRGSTANYLAKVDKTSGNLDTTFTQATGLNSTAYGVAVSGSSVYATGNFSTYRGSTAKALAKVDATSGNLDTTFTAATGLGGGANPYGRAVVASGTSIYVAGAFQDYRGTAAYGVAKVDATSGVLDGTFTASRGLSNGLSNGAAIAHWGRALAVSGSTLFVGGDFAMYRGSPAPFLAKVSATTYVADPTFNQSAGANNVVYSLSLSSTSLYVGGAFTAYRGSTANYLAKVDTTNGTLDTTFTQTTGPNGTVRTVLESGGSIFVGGNYTTYRGGTALYLAKVNGTSGNLDTTFTQATGANGEVMAIAVSGTSLFVGGLFTTYRGATANRLAKLSTTSGDLDTTFTQATGPGNDVYAVAANGSSVYVGGRFTTYRGANATYLAKVDATSGDLDTTFTQSPVATNYVWAIALSGSSVYLAGNFTLYRGANARRLAKVDATSGNLDTTFTQSTGLDGSGYALAVAGSELLVGGPFLSYRGLTTKFFAPVDLTSGAAK